jgi:CheY-like chemotaxis protein
LGLLAEHQIALLLTDYLLPDMDGFQLAASVKAASPTTYTVLTAVDDPRTFGQREHDQAVDLFLAKADLLEQLADVIERVLPSDA